MTDEQLARMADTIIDAMCGFVSRSLAPIAQRMEAIEKRPPPRDGADGRDGRDGADGKDADPELIAKMVADAVQALPPPRNGTDGRDGRDGKDADAAAIAKTVLDQVTTALDAIPLPKDGRDGKDADPAVIAEMVRAAVAVLPPPAPGRDGKDADPELIAKMVADAVQALPPPRNGTDGRDGRDGKDGKDGKDADPELIRAEVAKAISALPVPADGRDGRDGPPGRDALAIDILPGIDAERCYPRGTFAQLNGGIVRAARNTDPVADGDYIAAGWVHVIRGLAGVEVQQNDERRFEIALAYSDGAVEKRAFSMPVMIYRGIWREREYERGDTVTWDGATWECEAERTSAKPGTEKSGWRLSVKRGRDGRDGLRGEKGERGAEGRPGRDLTQLGADGSKW